MVTRNKNMALVLKKKFLTEPKQIIKFVVLLACVVFTIYQLAECVRKIIHPPISTHYNFYLNDTIKYPSLTICRRPPYKTELFPTYGLRQSTVLNAQNAFSSFRFDNFSVLEFLESTSYSFDEIFVQYGYAGIGSNPNLIITSAHHLMSGLCHTLEPQVQSQAFSISGGYFFYLSHNEATRNVDENGESLSGFEIYLHDHNEILTYEEDQKDSFLEFLYLEASEDMNVVLNIQTYGRISTNDVPCVNDPDYSKSKCQEYCVHLQVAQTAGCTLPWLILPENVTFPQCSDFESVRNLIADLRNSRAAYVRNCDCLMNCNITIFSTKIVNRREMDELNAPNSMIALYYSSNLVTKLSEVVGYDWNQFLSDIGGSLGFLLGLSVIGLISMAEEICQILFRWMFAKKNKQLEEDKQNEELSKDNKEKESNRDEVECTENKDVVNEKNCTKDDHNYKNLMDYFADYSYYEKALVDKDHDKKNKF
ncbi:uncharacterized protein LOC108903430 [Anoplophora glabripennis]|uniref:uncharacterized protein LOC108903430 n=1 Tax=Anoplophora glabripennis TaxID=217634 RepID=UPI000873FEA0|nr:uncharacterized protein LOC108903430 [Anoplophora glabripennis]